MLLQLNETVPGCGVSLTLRTDGPSIYVNGMNTAFKGIPKINFVSQCLPHSIGLSPHQVGVLGSNRAQVPRLVPELVPRMEPGPPPVPQFSAI